MDVLTLPLLDDPSDFLDKLLGDCIGVELLLLSWEDVYSAICMEDIKSALRMLESLGTDTTWVTSVVVDVVEVFAEGIDEGEDSSEKTSLMSVRCSPIAVILRPGRLRLLYIL